MSSSAVTRPASSPLFPRLLGLTLLALLGLLLAVGAQAQAGPDAPARIGPAIPALRVAGR